MRIHAPRLLALVLVVFASGALAQEPPTDPRVAAFRQALDADRQRLSIPGLSAVILEDGEVLWADGLGYADVERQVPATADTLYHIASVTKTFTAVLVHRLVEQGRLRLDDPVARYDPTVADRRIRIRHLLSHTADGVPGTAFAYNPDRFEHLKAVLEAVTHKPLRQQLAEEILDPLGMHASVPGADVADDDGKWALLGPERLARYRRALAAEAKGYTVYGDGEIVCSGSPERDFWASAGLVAPVRDLARYDAAIDRHALLEESTLRAAWTPFVSNAGTPLAFGLGWYVTDYRGERLVTHYGHWGTSFSALYLKVPARGLTLVVLANSEALADHHYKIGGEDVTNDVIACRFLTTFVPRLANGTYPGTRRGGPVTADDEPPTVPGSPTKVSTDCERSSEIAFARWRRMHLDEKRPEVPYDAATAAELAGRYRLPHRDLEVTNEGGRLFIDVPRDGGHAELFASAPGEYFIKNRAPWKITFPREAGKVVRLEIDYRGEVTPAPRVE
jgi:CubicO group peptidase (beta-lactamase class C family)